MVCIQYTIQRFIKKAFEYFGKFTVLVINVLSLMLCFNLGHKNSTAAPKKLVVAVRFYDYTCCFIHCIVAFDQCLPPHLKGYIFSSWKKQQRDWDLRFGIGIVEKKIKGKSVNHSKTAALRQMNSAYKCSTDISSGPMPSASYLTCLKSIHLILSVGQVTSKL